MYNSTIGGMQYGGCGEDKKEKIVSQQLGVSTGYGDAHRLMLMQGVGIAMQQMH